MKIPYLLMLAAVTASGCASNQDSRFVSASCDKAGIAGDRSIYVCPEGPIKLDAFKRALLRAPDKTLDAKEIARTFDVPPSEISGVVAASGSTGTRANEDIVTINQRSFAVYKRSDATILVERP